ncbi:hypothetical protein JHD48_06670 [Sulfurimonas sp. SAG-AH-194-I05]|nr:hypothetical protein [Sulfurimonas sp. SAG-AH-194-I05]MDF1875412.1 hypothetical protein [Sulfurimonas sp. SAG-AH-194-I05]
MNDYTMGGFGMGLGWFIPLLVVGILFYLFNENKNKDSSAKDILDKRYANGEIDEQEYKTKTETLR